MKNRPWHRALLQIFQDGHPIWQQPPQWLRQAQSAARPWLEPWVSSRPYTEGIAAAVALMGVVWLMLFASLLIFPTPVPDSAPRSAWVSSSSVGQVPGRQQGPTLAAVVLNQNLLQKRLQKALYPEAWPQTISFEVKVWVSPAGQYLSHEILRSNHPSVATALHTHLPDIDCLPALQNGKPVISWVLLSYHIAPKQWQEQGQ